MLFTLSCSQEKSINVECNRTVFSFPSITEWEKETDLHGFPLIYFNLKIENNSDQSLLFDNITRKDTVFFAISNKKMFPLFLTSSHPVEQKTVDSTSRSLVLYYSGVCPEKVSSEIDYDFLRKKTLSIIEDGTIIYIPKSGFSTTEKGGLRLTKSMTIKRDLGSYKKSDYILNVKEE